MLATPLEHRDLTPVEILHRLVSFDSSTPDGVNALLDFAAEYLESHGIRSRRVPTPDGLSQSLIARIGPADSTGGIALMGHVDVAPPVQSDWAFDPFRLQEDDRSVSGLGVCNMKGFISVLLARAPDFALRRLDEPITLILTTRHETVELSLVGLIRELQLPGYSPEGIILGYPTDMRVALSHKGHYRLATAVRGAAVNPAHNNRGVNAIWLASHLIDYIEKIQGEAKNFKSDVADLDPPWSTLNVGSLSGGATAQAMANAAAFDWEIRPIPELRADELINQFNRYADAVVRELRETAPRVSVETAVLRRRPGFRVDCHSSISEMVADLTGSPPIAAVPFVTEAPVLQRANIPVAVCGPGQMLYAGTSMESLQIRDLHHCSEFMFAMLDYLESHIDKGRNPRSSVA